MSEEHLTIEALSKIYPSQFDLVNRAIEVAADIIITGRAPRVKWDYQNKNVATIVLDEILERKDTLPLLSKEEVKKIDTNVIPTRHQPIEYGTFKTNAFGDKNAARDE